MGVPHVFQFFPLDPHRLSEGPGAPVAVFESFQFFPSNHKQLSIMPIDIITPADLQHFKQELLTEMEKLLSQNQTITPMRKWLKSHQVMRLLALSPGTLAHLRVNGTLPYTKIGGVIFYDYEDLQKMLEDNKRNHHFAGKKLAMDF